MGAWGTGIFEDDAALDFVAEVTAAGDAAAVEEALRVAAEEAYLDADLAARALVAASVVAALADGGGELPDDLRGWVAARKAPTGDVMRQAQSAVLRVLRESELRDLWAESDELDAWCAGLQGLAERLERRQERA